MGSTLQEELKRQMEQQLVSLATATPKPQPAPATIVEEQRKLAGIQRAEPKPQVLSEDTQGWHLSNFARSLTEMCEEIEQRLGSTLRGLEQYKVTDPSEIALKPGKSLKDMKGAAKELQSKIIQARRIASSIECELKTTTKPL